jgi:hypothetical protein
MVFWLPPLLIIGGVAIFWKQIAGWWNGPAEEIGEKQAKSESGSEDDEEE